jgi:S-formylglutathione hydrolase FrmB
MGIPSRRGLLISGVCAAAGMVAGATGYGLVEGGVLPGKYRLDDLLGACGSDPGVPRFAAGPVSTQRFYSWYRRRMVNMIVMRPPGKHGPLPVVLVLHGAGGDAASAVGLGYPQYLAAQYLAAQYLARAAGSGVFAAVAADGGGSTYWHRRADGDDPQGMLIHEVLPRLRQQGFQVDRVGISGWSMGGYGALLLAVRMGPAATAGVAAASAAIFASYADAIAANPGSFDSPADFAANNVQSAAAVHVLRQIPVRIDCGSDDPFAAQDAALRSQLGDPAGAIGSGCHDEGFWRRSLPAELAFLGQHVAPRSST